MTTSIQSHITRCLIAGVVAILPLGGLVLSVMWVETTISESWLADQPWYFPGLGILVSLVSIYLVGLTLTSLIGRWLWRLADSVLESLPLLGSLYATLKQIVGYGEGEGALFQGVVLVPHHEDGHHELGLITNRSTSAEGVARLTVFIPLAPTATAGRLIVIDADRVAPVDMPVSEALQTLVSIGTSSNASSDASK